MKQPNTPLLTDDLDPAKEVIFTRDVDFTEAVFNSPVNFGDVTFCGYAIFARSRFEKGVSFFHSVFRRRVDFEGAVFCGPVDFSSVIFATAVRFDGVLFQQSARFSEALFNWKAYFERTSFRGAVDFSSAGFNANATFNFSRFAGYANFSHAVFSYDAAFRHTEFTGPVAFEGTTFSNSFQKRAQVDDVLEPERAASPVVADFTDATFDSPAQVCFRRVNMENPANPTRETKPKGFRARFIACDVSAVRFDSVNWNFEKGRLTLESEIEAAEASTLTYRLLRKLWNLVADRKKVAAEDRYELIATTYRQLVTNFERAGNADLAEDCYCGAMEMIRLDPSRPLLTRTILRLYRWASNYGSSYARAFGVLLLLMLLTAFAFMLPRVGLARVSGGTPLSISGWSVIPAGLFHALEVATFQRDVAFAPTTLMGRLVAIVATIVLPGQVALLLLAIRRRFRR